MNTVICRKDRYFMKRMLIGLLLVSMILSVTACSSSSNKLPLRDSNADGVNESATQSSDVTLGSEGISITLPKDFAADKLDLSDNTDIITSFSNDNETIAIFVIKELKSDLDGINSASEYLQVQCDNMPDGVISGDKIFKDTEGNYILDEDDGVEYFEYTNINIGSDSFKYLSTAYESDDAFWFVQFTCAVDDYDSNKADFIKWAKTVSFY